MNEADFAEIEKTLLFISDARERAQRALRALQKNGAEPHLIEALRDSEAQLAALHRSLMQATYFAVPSEQLAL